jgi:hypothetical protein
MKYMLFDKSSSSFVGLALDAKKNKQTFGGKTKIPLKECKSLAILNYSFFLEIENRHFPEKRRNCVK